MWQSLASPIQRCCDTAHEVIFKVHPICSECQIKYGIDGHTMELLIRTARTRAHRRSKVAEFHCVATVQCFWNTADIIWNCRLISDRNVRRSRIPLIAHRMFSSAVDYTLFTSIDFLFRLKNAECDTHRPAPPTEKSIWRCFSLFPPPLRGPRRPLPVYTSHVNEKQLCLGTVVFLNALCRTEVMSWHNRASND